MKAGSICDPAHCDETSFSFVGDGKCDAAGTCIYPDPVNCLKNNPCQFDLCSDSGCEVAIKNDGTDCGGGQECVGGVCGGMGATASSSSSSSGAGGSGGEGGTGGSGGAGGTGGSGGDLYPPAPEDPGGCSCRAATEVPAGGGVAVVIAGLGLLLRRRARVARVAGARFVRTR
jgi:MYXO-CTERM domain-containing protein